MSGVPTNVCDGTTTGAITGTPFAVPFRTFPTINPLAVKTGNVSAFEYTVQASVDGTTFVPLVTGITSQADFNANQYLFVAPVLRIDQVSRTGGTSQAIYVTLGQY